MVEESKIKNIIIQGATIIFSILMAFVIDAWWANRKDNLNEVEQLRAIRSELILGVENLEGILSTTNHHSKNIDSLILLLKNGGNNPVDVSGNLMGSTIMWRTSDVSISTLNALMASGSLNQLNNPSLKVKLAGLPAQLFDLTEDEIFAKEFSENHMSTFLARQGLAEVAYSNRPGFTREDSIDFAIPKFIEVIPSEEFIGLLTVRRVHFWYTQTQLPNLQVYIEDLIHLINDELKNRG
jgi:hypothetical protein